MTGDRAANQPHAHDSAALLQITGADVQLLKLTLFLNYVGGTGGDGTGAGALKGVRYLHFSAV